MSQIEFCYLAHFIHFLFFDASITSQNQKHISVNARLDIHSVDMTALIVGVGILSILGERHLLARFTKKMFFFLQNGSIPVFCCLELFSNCALKLMAK